MDTCILQGVKASLPTQPDHVLVLPFDLCGSFDTLEKAASTADSAFGAAGVDYLIHNAGQASKLCQSCYPVLWTWTRKADASTETFSLPYFTIYEGASQHAMAEDVSAEVTDRMFELNTLGPIKLARAALSHMLRRKKGRMVVIASMAAKVPSPGQAVYSGKPREVGHPHSGCPN